MHSRATRTPHASRQWLAVVVLALAVAVSGGLVGCVSGEADDDTLTIYSGRTKELIGPLLERFSKDTGQKIEVRYGDSADLALQIVEEGDKSPADVFISQSPGAMDFLSQEDRLATLSASVLDRVEPEFRSPDDEWVGLSGRVRVLVYNTEHLGSTPLPESVFDLTKPEYRDKVAVAPTNGSFQDFVTAMRAEIGDDATLEFLEGLAANGAQPFANNTAIVEAVGRGEIEMGLVNHYYNERAKVENPGVASENHHFESGDLGNLILVTGSGVLRTSDQGSEASDFLTYLLSRSAQEYFAEETFEYPLAAGVEPAVDLPPLSSIEAPIEDLGALGDLAVTARLIDQSGLGGG